MQKKPGGVIKYFGKLKPSIEFKFLKMKIAMVSNKIEVLCLPFDISVSELSNGR